jgi:hypothetical protein
MQLPESTFNLILSAIMGAISGLLTIPLNAWIVWKLKSKELTLQHKLDIIAKERELFLQHRLEMKRKETTTDELFELKESIKKLEQRVNNG